jgi:hypothetical protein
MESQSVPPAPGIPLVLRAEFERAFATRCTPAALLEAARAAGMRVDADRAALPRHAAREPPGPDAPAALRPLRLAGRRTPRRGLAALPDAEPGSSFDPAALSPVLFVAASDADFGAWLPLSADPEADCVAPVETTP